MLDDVATKLAPLGLTQHNECINSIVGTKNSKKRFYRGSESGDYRVSAAVAQFNEGHEYMKAVEQNLLCRKRNTECYTTERQQKMKQSADRKQEASTKKGRRELNRKRKHNQMNRARREGSTYCSGKSSSCIIY